MATYKVCHKHGVYRVQKGQPARCPECKPEPSKRSKKYGGRVIHIPPHMKARDRWQSDG